jgi:chromosome partitioning protein
MPFVIALWSQKGGVAKTTTALALGGCLVERGHATLLLDLDPQGNLTSGLGFDPGAMPHSTADVLLGNDLLSNLSREAGLPGLDLVPANPDMVAVSRWLYVRQGYEPLLRDALARPDVAHYHFVVIDCPPVVGPLSVTALTAANLVIVPTQCEYFSAQALNASLEMVRLARARTNPALAYRLLVTMFDQRGSLHGRVLTQLKQHFAEALFQTVIGVDSKLKESQLAGRLIVQHAQGSRGAHQYRALAEELLTYVQEPVFQTA